MNKAVILGAGLATRLYPVTHHIPKVLVNYKQHTILKHLYDIYEQYGANEIIVVVHSKFIGITKKYAESQGLTRLKFVAVDEAYGSAYAISQIPDLKGHNVIFNWCDVIPQFGEDSWGQNTIYTHGNQCRYNFDGEVLKNVGLTGGNVVGVYQQANFDFPQFDSKDEANEFFRGRDYIDFISGPEYAHRTLIDLIDIGDKEKLLAVHQGQTVAREFNNVQITENMVYKTATNEKGIELQKLEIDWYHNVESESVPEIYNYRGELEGNMISMERIKGKEMRDVFTEAHLPRIMDALKFSDTCHCPTNAERFADFKYEIIDKVLARCESIEGILNAHGPITHVNGIEIGRLPDMLKRAFAHIIDCDDTLIYKVIHGDPNFSNMFETDTGEIKLIDPRGYFGTSKVFGPTMYDECKVLYAMTGYDKFNSDPLWGGLTIDGVNVDVDIEQLIPDAFESDYFADVHRLWVAVIWVALGGYFKNNPLKAYASYYHGMYLLTVMLRRMGRKLSDRSISKDLEHGQLAVSTLRTKNPGKWLLIDLETGQKYKPSTKPFGLDWERIGG